MIKNVNLRLMGQKSPLSILKRANLKLPLVGFEILGLKSCAVIISSRLNYFHATGVKSITRF